MFLKLWPMERFNFEFPKDFEVKAARYARIIVGLCST